MPGVQGGEQRPLVDQAAAGDVDEDGARLHRGEGRLAEQLSVRPVEHRAAHGGVRLAEDGEQLAWSADVADTGRAAKIGMGAHAEQPCSERREPLRERYADSAEADDRHGRPEQKAAGGPDRPAAIGQRRPYVVQPADQREQVQDGQLGDAVGIAADLARNPGHPHAELGRPADVDLFQPDTELVDQAEPAGLEHRGVDPGAQRAHDVDSVQVITDPRGRAGPDRPARQQFGDRVPPQLGGKPVPGEQDDLAGHARLATSSLISLRRPV